MRPINLAGFDLNLFIVFEALYEERHVSRAAAKIGLSQPSMSHALARLRAMFDDELFVRGPGGMHPTVRATELAQHVLPGLSQLRSSVEGGVSFEPDVSERSFIIGMNDMSTFIGLPRILPILRAQAPGVALTVIDVNSRVAIEKLNSGEIELALGVFPEIPPAFDIQTLTAFSNVCISDAGNPRLKGRALDLDTFFELPHVQVINNSDPIVSIDAELAALFLRRRIAVIIPNFLAMPSAIVGTDMIGIFPDAFIDNFRAWPLRVDPLPVPLPELGFSMLWHRRYRKDPGHVWLRRILAEGLDGPDHGEHPYPSLPASS